ncbi:MAG: hypothetical protein CMJ58_27380 [Planctomycetaceae bacterium]|nr:hypothetical protein [Planctomycetaceae bacterium]
MSAAFQFKVTLIHSNPPIWRRIFGPEGSLDDLHQWIQSAMGRENAHLHRFEMQRKQYGDPQTLDDGFGESNVIDSFEADLATCSIGRGLSRSSLPNTTLATTGYTSWNLKESSIHHGAGSRQAVWRRSEPVRQKTVAACGAKHACWMCSLTQNMKSTKTTPSGFQRGSTPRRFALPKRLKRCDGARPLSCGGLAAGGTSL